MAKPRCVSSIWRAQALRTINCHQHTETAGFVWRAVAGSRQEAGYDAEHQLVQQASNKEYGGEGTGVYF